MAGSPPRMRGRRPRRGPPPSFLRLTPAYAGKTPVPVGRIGVSGAHPRVCGEDSAGGLNSWSDAGSPPRMRGRRSSAMASRSQSGLTPAYAGKTGRACRHEAGQTAHPRVCGEDIEPGGLGGLAAGSPPRMRGRRSDPTRLRLDRRLTPAYAGKTDSPGPGTTSPRAHPRVCGEDGLAERLDAGGGGLTPAYAGKT